MCRVGEYSKVVNTLMVSPRSVVMAASCYGIALHKDIMFWEGSRSKFRERVEEYLAYFAVVIEDASTCWGC